MVLVLNSVLTPRGSGPVATISEVVTDPNRPGGEVYKLNDGGETRFTKDWIYTHYTVSAPA